MREGWGQQKAPFPAQHHRAQAQQGNQGGLGSSSRSKTPQHPQWEEGEGRNVGIQKKPQEAPQQRAKSEHSTRVEMWESRRAWGKGRMGKRVGWVKKRELRGSGMGYIPSTQGLQVLNLPGIPVDKSL